MQIRNWWFKLISIFVLTWVSKSLISRNLSVTRHSEFQVNRYFGTLKLIWIQFFCGSYTSLSRRKKERRSKGKNKQGDPSSSSALDMVVLPVGKHPMGQEACVLMVWWSLGKQCELLWALYKARGERLNAKTVLSVWDSPVQCDKMCLKSPCTSISASSAVLAHYMTDPCHYAL